MLSLRCKPLAWTLDPEVVHELADQRPVCWPTPRHSLAQAGGPRAVPDEVGVAAHVGDPMQPSVHGQPIRLVVPLHEKRRVEARRRGEIETEPSSASGKAGG